jgi:hypothetical protein
MDKYQKDIKETMERYNRIEQLNMEKTRKSFASDT